MIVLVRKGKRALEISRTIPNLVYDLPVVSGDDYIMVKVWSIGGSVRYYMIFSYDEFAEFEKEFITRF